MSVSRIASRYAKPILELAEEKKVLEEVMEDMANFVSLCNENRAFFLTLGSPIIPHLRKAEILNKIFKGKVNDMTLQAFNLVTRKNRADLLKNVAEEFINQYNDKKGLQEVSVTSSIKLTSKQLKGLEKIASDMTGKKPVVTEYVDPEVIGGYILKIGDRQIDQSISGQLKDIKLKFQTK